MNCCKSRMGGRMKSLKEALIERKEVIELGHKHHSSNKVNYVDAIIENLKCQEDLKKAVLEFKERYFDREIYCKELGESIFDEIFGDWKND